MFQLAWLILFYESDHQNILFLLCDFYNITPKEYIISVMWFLQYT